MGIIVEYEAMNRKAELKCYIIECQRILSMQEYIRDPLFILKYNNALDEYNSIIEQESQ